MATIVLSSFVFRYPVGGVLSNNLQFLTGFARLGHEVYLVEKAGWDDSCFDPERRVNSNDCSCGVRRVSDLLERHGLGGRSCYVDADGTYHGLDRRTIEQVAARADLFIDRGLHRTWDDETADVPVRVLLDPDPGFRQVKMVRDFGDSPPHYDAYYTYGYNVGTPRSLAPTAGVDWQHVFHPIDTSLYTASQPAPGSPCTTVTNWKPLEQVTFDGRVFGMKDVQFPAFEALPSAVNVPMEVAVEGSKVPRAQLESAGWHVVQALDVTVSYDDYHRYIQRSLAEFSVVKDVYRGLNVGWFSDRSAAYLAQGRPVVVQGNGIADHLPTGEGLFEVDNIEEAAEAISAIAAEPARHSDAARRIAEQHLDTDVVLGRLLDELGIARPHRTNRRPT